MARRVRLTPEELQAAMSALPKWSVAEGKLRREYKFPDFAHAFGFMAAVATAAEKLDHHPDWSNVYNRVIVTLWTHSEGGLTELDFELAAKMEALADKLS